MSIMENARGRLRHALALGLILLSASASADLGRVEWYSRQCGLVLVKTDLGYSLAQFLGAGMVSEGDMLVGDFDGETRMRDVKNASMQTQFSIWVQRVATDKNVAMESVPAHCRD